MHETPMQETTIQRIAREQREQAQAYGREAAHRPGPSHASAWRKPEQRGRGKTYALQPPILSSWGGGLSGWHVRLEFRRQADGQNLQLSLSYRDARAIIDMLQRAMLDGLGEPLPDVIEKEIPDA